MENVILCSGRYAQTPYFLEDEKLRIYSIEELCYFLYKNAYLIRDDFFSQDLLKWIDTELGLKEWSMQLQSLQQQENRNGGEKGILQSIAFLFQASGFYGEEEISQVRAILQDSSHLSVLERRKIRADVHYRKKRYVKAAAEYEQILTETGDDQIRFRAKLYHNLGVCSAAMFFYDKAADYFLKAFHLYPNTESYVQFLGAMKLGNSQEKYLEYLSEHPESYEDSLEVEGRLRSILEEWEKQSFDEKIQDRMKKDQSTYYNVIKELLRDAKDDYINMVDKR